MRKFTGKSHAHIRDKSNRMHQNQTKIFGDRATGPLACGRKGWYTPGRGRSRTSVLTRSVVQGFHVSVGGPVQGREAQGRRDERLTWARPGVRTVARRCGRSRAGVLAAVDRAQAGHRSWQAAQFSLPQGEPPSSRPGPLNSIGSLSVHQMLSQNEVLRPASGVRYQTWPGTPINYFTVNDHFPRWYR